ncbi:flagellin FlaB [Methanococcus voltae PS]|jgi:flagellin FlaB|uniref:Flagellin n=1 Tax=Methanococcus voltae PS TaxID=523842 RepID=A0ABT2EVD1_METVO|nr:flagellin [Methanococcus voltae]MCS3921401.1 flagellin FlaB [Methanococcus voltae PS]
MLKNFMKNKKGAVGIGTLIIFIALVLVAAVAASVIINTAGKLQHKAAVVGQESTQQVASGLQVVKITGHSVDQYNLDKIAILVSPNIGDEIDLATTVVTFSTDDRKMSLLYDSSNASNGGKVRLSTANGTSDIFKYDDVYAIGAWPFEDPTYGQSDQDPNEKKFGIVVLQDMDNSVSGEHPTVNYGDKVLLAINIGNIVGENIGNRIRIQGEVVPEFGAPGIIDFTTPPVYANRVVALQ